MLLLCTPKIHTFGAKGVSEKQKEYIKYIHKPRELAESLNKMSTLLFVEPQSLSLAHVIILLTMLDILNPFLLSHANPGVTNFRAGFV